MLPLPASTRVASRRAIWLVLWGLAGGCATYENTQPNANGALADAGTDAGGGAGMSGTGAEAGAAIAGSSSGAPSGGSGAGGGAAGTTSIGGAMAGMGGSQAGTAGAPAAGAGGVGGAGGAGGAGGKASAGAGGKAAGGNGGAGGSPAIQTCAKNPITAKSKWTVTASATSNGDPTTNAYDDVLTNRWATGTEQVGGEWLQLDFSATVTLTKLTLVLGSSVNDYPRKYATRFSNSSMNNAAPVLVSGMGAASTDTVMNFPAGTTGRYVLISQSGTAPGLWWSVAEIQAQCAD